MTDTRRRLRIAGVALLLGLVGVSAARAGMEIPSELPPDSPEIGSAERQALIDFQQDPMANGKALLQVSAGSAKRLPLVVLLAAGDVHLRAGRLHAATRFFREAERRKPGPPWDGFARLGLGWTALARHEFGAAAKYYRGIDPATPLAGIARVMTAWLTAWRGRYAEAKMLFDAAAAAADLPPNVRQVALLGAAYTRYWLGAFDEAAVAFDGLVSPPSVLTDDARYGAAWARFRAGRPEVAIPALVALAEAPSDAPPDASPKRLSESAVSLAPSTITRSGRESTARISGFAGPDARLVAIFDDGVALARAALGMLLRRGEVDPREIPATLVPALPELADDVPGSDRPSSGRVGAQSTVPARAEPRAAAGGSWWRVWWIGMGVLVLAIVVVALRRGDARTSAPTR